MDEQIEEKVFENSVNEEGSFKTLGHSMAFNDQLKSLPENGPDPYRYEAGEDDRFQQDLAMFKLKSSVKEGVKEALPRLPPHIPDVDFFARRSAAAWEKEYLQKALEARMRGDLHEEQAHLERAKWGRKDRESIGPTWAEKEKAKGEFQFLKKATDLLFDPRLQGNEVWQNPRIQNDALCATNDFNHQTDGLTLIVRREKVPNSRQYETVGVGGFVRVDFESAARKKEFLSAIDSGHDPAMVIRNMGLSRFLDESKPRREVKPVVDHGGDPEKMTQQEFEKWRLANGAKRR
jgi:hypothetical protein